MPLITITFDHPDAAQPRFSLMQRVAITDDCAPKHWRVGLVIGITFQDTYHPGWWYSIKLDEPYGYTEEYLESDLVVETEITALQSQWEQDAACVGETPDSDVEVRFCYQGLPNEVFTPYTPATESCYLDAGDFRRGVLNPQNFCSL